MIGAYQQLRGAKPPAVVSEEIRIPVKIAALVSNKSRLTAFEG
jgi:hypothetical protein